MPRKNRLSDRSANEFLYLLQANELAEQGEGHTRPNPPVGAVIVRNGRVIGRGYHARAGAEHAEVMAIRSCRGRTQGADMYVTLEPCSRPGRVGPCTKAIIDAGIRRVVYACSDPNPVNRGRAKRVLERAGIVCEKAERDRFFTELIAPFAKFITTGMPYVTVKFAMSLDGRICDDRGNSRWISSARKRAVTGDLRRRCDAIMVGAETIRRDNPSLLWHEGDNPDLIRVVISRSGRLPKDAQVFTDGRNETLVYRSPQAALKALAKRGCLHVVCEGGMKLAVSMARKGLVDSWLTVVAPIVIGDKPLAKAVRIKEFTCLQD